MRAYYQLIESIRDFLEQHESINTVKLGNISEVDLEKQTLFPLAQIIVGDTSFQGNVMTFNIKVLAMDSVLLSTDDPRLENDSFKGVDNKQDVFNTMLTAVNALQNTLKRGQLFKNNFQLDGEPIATPFEDDFGNLLTGWSLDFDVIVPNTEMADCDFNITTLDCIVTFDSTNLTFDNN